MSKLKTVTRRTFLIGSAAIAGGVAFGTYTYKRDPENPLHAHLQEGQAAITPYVKIDSGGITLITPRTDMGQGAYSMQACLIAEELDVELDQVKVDPGMPDPAYYNTALSDDAVPFRSTDDSLPAQSARSIIDALAKFLGLQITGGSTSVPDAYEKLRYAGAVARETLKAAAAQKSGVPVFQLRTEKGTVILPDGKVFTYTELAPIAAAIAPVKNVQLRGPGEWRLIGKPMLRRDIIAKSTGTLTYGIDFELEGMVYAAIKTNPRQGGAMNSYNAGKTGKMRGVQKIVPLENGVAVIADNSWRAFKAVDAIEFDWGNAPYPAEMDAHWQALSDSFTNDRLDARTRDDGEIDAVFAEGPSDFEAEYRVPYLAHQPLEPLSAIVKIEDNRVDVWTGTQIPGFVRSNVAKITGLSEDQVFVHVLYIGGSFGHRLEDEVVKQAAQIAKTVKGTPVKLTYSREEDFAHDYPRQIAMARAKGKVKDGRVESFDLSIAMPSVIASQMGRQNYTVPGPDPAILAGAWDQPYKIPNYRTTGYRAPELAPISSWRSVGASSNGFFHECALDELIHVAGGDPLEERIRLMWHEPSRRTLQAVGEMSNWHNPLGPDKARGVAFCLSFGTAVAEIVEVTNTPAGIRIDNVYVATEVGKIIDPVNFENLVQGGVIWGLGHAINCQTTYADGMAEQSNFHDFEGMRLYQCPKIHIRGLENGTKITGIGEPPVPPAAPALANAIFAATGKRIREMPFNKHIDFV